MSLSIERHETIRFITVAISVVTVLTIFIYSIWQTNLTDDRQNYELFQKALEQGYDPVLIKCAFSPMEVDESLCILTRINVDPNTITKLHELR